MAELSGATKLRFIKPDLEQARGDARLLVWGELGHWMVVDEELHAFLLLFNGKRPLTKVVSMHARRQGRPVVEVGQEVEVLLSGLVGKGVLRGVGATPPKAPTPELRLANVTLNLTNRCNLRCSFCYNDAEQVAKEELPAGQLMDALEEARPLLAPDATLIILGGEPTLRMERLVEVVQRGGKIFGPPPLVSTNGTLLSEERVQQLAQLRVEVQVSLDGPTAAAHDQLRGEGTFDKAVAGVASLAQRGVRVILSMVFSRRSQGQLEAYLDLARSLGAAEARFIPMRLVGRGQLERAQLPDLEAVFDELLGVLGRRPELRSLLGRDYFSILDTLCRHSGARDSCGIGSQVVFIDADGAIYPCPNHRLPELCCGKLGQVSLAEAVQRSPLMLDLRRRYHVDQYPPCRSCAFRRWCAGDCRGEVLQSTGDPLAASPHCAALQQIIPRLLWLAADGQDLLGVTARGSSSQDRNPFI